MKANVGINFHHISQKLTLRSCLCFIDAQPHKASEASSSSAPDLDRPMVQQQNPPLAVTDPIQTDVDENNNCSSIPVQQPSTNCAFVFSEFQGVTCLGIPTPPSSVCSNNSSLCAEEILPGPATPEVTDGKMQSPINTSSEEQHSHEREIHDSVPSVQASPSRASDLYIPPIPSPLSPLGLTPVPLSSSKPSTSVPIYSSTPSKKSNVCGIIKLQQSTAPTTVTRKPRPVALKRPQKKSSKLVKLKPASKRSLAPCLATCLQSMVRRSPPPLAPIKNYPKRIVPQSDSKTPLYYLMPTSPQYHVPTNRLLTPCTPHSAPRMLMVPFRPTIQMSKPRMQSAVPRCSAVRPLHSMTVMPKLTQVEQPRGWNLPVIDRLPQIEVYDVCQTLGCDEWIVNLELQPRFEHTILHGFDYDTHCRRPLATECRFSLHDSFDADLLQQPDASHTGDNTDFLAAQNVKRCLPPNTICPPCIIADKSAHFRRPWWLRYQPHFRQ